MQQELVDNGPVQNPFVPIAEVVEAPEIEDNVKDKIIEEEEKQVDMIETTNDLP